MLAPLYQSGSRTSGAIVSGLLLIHIGFSPRRLHENYKKVVENVVCVDSWVTESRVWYPLIVGRVHGRPPIR
jgi:hypothetical protein